LERKLAESGYKTWLDVNDMGANINDSMASALEDARLIIVLFSRKCTFFSPSFPRLWQQHN
jgi:hypothetical protein